MNAPELIAVAVFLFTYALIIDERIHRAVAAMLGASVIVLLQIVGDDPRVHRPRHHLSS